MWPLSLDQLFVSRNLTGSIQDVDIDGVTVTGATVTVASAIRGVSGMSSDSVDDAFSRDKYALVVDVVLTSRARIELDGGIEIIAALACQATASASITKSSIPSLTGRDIRAGDRPKCWSFIGKCGRWLGAKWMYNNMANWTDATHLKFWKVEAVVVRRRQCDGTKSPRTVLIHLIVAVSAWLCVAVRRNFLWEIIRD